jgi:hypothetical protein
VSVFVLKDSETLVALQPAEFASEDDFQRLLAKFPSLLSGGQTDDTSPRRWLLLKREKSIPGEDGGAGRWSVDHLFIDQDGVPTLVEVKRQSDTRLRREVVGQMLDYAANAVVYWPIDQLRSEFEAGCNEKGTNPEEEIRSHLGVEIDPETLWQHVKTNLQAGRIRMLFVADQIPAELRRIVEFLNRQMDPAEMLALELRQFAGEGLKTIVPMVYGQTEEAQQKKAAGTPKRQWDEESVLAALGSRSGPEALRVAKRIGRWMKEHADEVWFGRGSQDGSMGMTIIANGHNYVPMLIWSYGRIEITFQYLMMRAPFDSVDKRSEFLRRLNEIDGVNLPANAIARRPSVPVATLSSGERLTSFLAVMDWLVQELRTG